LKIRRQTARHHPAPTPGGWVVARQSLPAGKKSKAKNLGNAMTMTAEAVPGKPKRTRSRVTTGRAVFVEGDGNSRWARRYRDLISAHCQDLGGVDVLSEAQLSLIRRASAIELELEQAEGKLSMGEAVDLDSFTRAASHLRRLFETIGVGRRARDVGLTRLEDILERGEVA
jgi:hypothetical protein